MSNLVALMRACLHCICRRVLWKHVLLRSMLDSSLLQMTSLGGL